MALFCLPVWRGYRYRDTSISDGDADTGVIGGDTDTGIQECLTGIPIRRYRNIWRGYKYRDTDRSDRETDTGISGGEKNTGTSDGDADTGISGGNTDTGIGGYLLGITDCVSSLSDEDMSEPVLIVVHVKQSEAAAYRRRVEEIFPGCLGKLQR